MRKKWFAKTLAGALAAAMLWAVLPVSIAAEAVLPPEEEVIAQFGGETEALPGTGDAVTEAEPVAQPEAEEADENSAAVQEENPEAADEEAEALPQALEDFPLRLLLGNPQANPPASRFVIDDTVADGWDNYTEDYARVFHVYAPFALLEGEALFRGPGGAELPLQLTVMEHEDTGHLGGVPEFRRVLPNGAYSLVSLKVEGRDGVYLYGEGYTPFPRGVTLPLYEIRRQNAENTPPAVLGATLELNNSEVEHAVLQMPEDWVDVQVSVSGANSGYHMRMELTNEQGKAFELMRKSLFLRQDMLGFEAMGMEAGVYRFTALEVWDEFGNAVRLDEGGLPAELAAKRIELRPFVVPQALPEVVQVDRDGYYARFSIKPLPGAARIGYRETFEDELEGWVDRENSTDILLGEGAVEGTDAFKLYIGNQPAQRTVQLHAIYKLTRPGVSWNTYAHGPQAEPYSFTLGDEVFNAPAPIEAYIGVASNPKWNVTMDQSQLDQSFSEEYSVKVRLDKPANAVALHFRHQTSGLWVRTNMFSNGVEPSDTFQVRLNSLQGYPSVLQNGSFRLERVETYHSGGMAVVFGLPGDSGASAKLNLEQLPMYTFTGLTGADTTAPVLQSINIKTPQIQTSDILRGFVSVQAELTILEEGTGLVQGESISIEFVHTQDPLRSFKASAFIGAGVPPAGGVYTLNASASFEPSDWVLAAGEYRIKALHIRDRAGNVAEYDAAALESFPSSITLVNDAQLVLGAPQGFAAEPGFYSVRYSWNAPVGATQYRIRVWPAESDNWGGAYSNEYYVDDASSFSCSMRPGEYKANMAVLHSTGRWPEYFGAYSETVTFTVEPQTPALLDAYTGNPDTGSRNTTPPVLQNDATPIENHFMVKTNMLGDGENEPMVQAVFKLKDSGDNGPSFHLYISSPTVFDGKTVYTYPNTRRDLPDGEYELASLTLKIWLPTDSNGSSNMHTVHYGAATETLPKGEDFPLGMELPAYQLRYGNVWDTTPPTLQEVTVSPGTLAGAERTQKLVYVTVKAQDTEAGVHRNSMKHFAEFAREGGGTRLRLPLYFMNATSTPDAQDVLDGNSYIGHHFAFGNSAADTHPLPANGRYTLCRVVVEDAAGNLLDLADEAIPQQMRAGFEIQDSVVAQPGPPQPQPQPQPNPTPVQGAEPVPEPAPEAVAVPQVASLRMSQGGVTLLPGKGFAATALAYGEEDELLTAELSWKSSKPEVAEVNTVGRISAKKAGKATITATTDNGKSASIKVTVVAKNSAAAKKLKVESVSASVPKTLKVGATRNVRGKFKPAGAVGAKLSYRSSKSSIVSIDKAGTLTAKKKGKAIITVQAGSVKKQFTVQVK